MADRTLIGVIHLGLGEILRTHKLTVPPNQREYSWTDKEVTTLLQDFAQAIREGGEDYFLGTIVIVSKGANFFEIVDGQQRLATAAILLAAIRDYLITDEPVIAESITREFLTSSSASMRELEPRIRLNLVDNQFFEGMISGKSPKATRSSHELIAEAFSEASSQVRKIVSQFDKKNHGDLLVDWVKFIRESAQVVMLTISSEGNAYRMFETLNDRGLKTTQADLVKNYLFGRAGQRLPEAQDKWSSMRAVLDALDEDRVPTVTFLRHALMLTRGYFRENALHDNIQQEAKSASQVAMLLEGLENFSLDYAALFNPESERWNGYPDAMRQALKVLDLLNIAGMRPLMLAVASKFTKKEATLSFKKFVSWKVRYLIAGSTLTGGYIEVPLAAAAKKVFDGEIADEKSLSKEMSSRIPTNEQFQSAFAEATVSKVALARYYLRSLEMVVKESPEPAFIPNNDRETINLEHILPQKPMGNWPTFNENDAKADCKRLGNMALMQAKKNSDLKSASFDEKKKVFKDGPYELTSRLASIPEWTHERVVERQALLAKLALKAWPL
jgi:uncharacterized protein with ParB-like and HNH nuclease domain